MSVFVRTTVRIRLRTVGILAIDYGLTLLLLFAFAFAGLVEFQLPLILLVLAAALNILFAGLIISGTTKRFHDASLTAVQIWTACGFHLLGLLMAPQIAYFFVINLFVPLSYGTVHFTQRMFLTAWLFISCASGAMIWTLSAPDTNAMATSIDPILFWATTVFALGRFIAINAQVSRLRIRLQRKNNELQLAAARLHDLSSRDELTGLWNRREFMRLLLEESRRAVRSQSNFCVAILDIDHFKKVNDTHGHLIGDAVLHELAQLLESLRRATDSVARYGDEEFTLLLVEAKITTATVALERIRSQVMQHDWETIAPELRLTISAGIAAWRPGETLSQVMNRADAALYEAKHSGRNCVRIASANALVTPAMCEKISGAKIPE